MKMIWITLIILANIFVYIRKIILARHEYKIAWFIVWGDWGNFMKLVETNRSPIKRKLLFALNLSPSLLFIMGILVAILDWIK